MHRYDAGRTLPILHAAKLTTPQVAVLEFVREPQTVSAVANYLGLSRPATSQLIDKLVRGRLISRKEGTIDRRERSVILNAKGRASSTGLRQPAPQGSTLLLRFSRLLLQPDFIQF
jgi:DNA-binding MarR family transcriptional regulator